MASKKTKVEWSGGMDKYFISKMRKSEEVKEVVEEKANEVLDDANDMMDVLYPNKFDYHYVLKSLDDKGYGETLLIVPTSPVARARKNKSTLNSAASRILTKKVTKRKK